jgi:hypothetical protein
MFALVLMIFCAATVIAQQPAPETRPAESRAITGRVVSESGQPLAGASVFAGPPSGSSGQRTSTDSEGNFKLQGLDAGLYRISANLPGYVIQPAQTDVNNQALYRPGESVSLTLVKGGVIAGMVTNIEGQPVVNVTVRVYRIRDAEGNKVRSPAFPQPRLSDDRGYYRIYGLQPGTYVVAAGGKDQYFGSVNPYANDAPTYAPASTRDTAAEVVVHSDQEATADIRYRGEPGHIISGRVAGVLQAPSSSMVVRLNDLDSHAMIASGQATGDNQAFQINNVADGEYEIMAFAAVAPNSDMLASANRRIAVRGADVTGVELAVTPLASIAGRINLELDDKLSCGRRRETALRETMIVVRRDRLADKPTPQTKDKLDQTDSVAFPDFTDSIPNDKGEIRFRNLVAATYRFEFRLPGAGWYVRELSAGPANQRAAANQGPAINLASNGIKLKSGDKIADVAITISEGGAGLRGQVKPGEGQSLPSGLRVYLAPAEREHNDNPLRFFEGAVTGDGTFAIGNLAPGKYWIVAQPAEAIDAKTMKSVKSDSAFRARVLRDAEKAKQEIAFKPCVRTVDYEVPFSDGTSKD